MDKDFISFDDTKIAFEVKSDFELRRTNFIFSTMKYPWMVDTGVFLTNLALTLRLPLKGLIKSTLFNQFCGGESIKDCSKAINSLGKYGVQTILDFSVEGQEEEASFDSTCEEVLKIADFASEQKNITFCVVKVTGIGSTTLLEKVQSGELDASKCPELDRVKERLHRIAAKCHGKNLRFMVDAEETWIQDVVDEMVLDLMLEFNQKAAVVYNTYQFYRKDALERMKAHFDRIKSAGKFFGAKIVRGAYLEKERDRAEELGYPDPIQQTKSDTDRDFDDAIRFVLDHVDKFSLCAGTHNEKSSALLATLMDEKGIAPNDERIYFAQLLGMSDHISFILSSKNYNVAKYMPYGPVKMVLPYLFRRAEENTSIAGQSSRELMMVRNEIKRRRQTNRS